MCSKSHCCFSLKLSLRKAILLPTLVKENVQVPDRHEDVILGFVGHISPESTPHSAMPAWPILFVKLFLNVTRYILLHRVQRQRIGCDLSVNPASVRERLRASDTATLP